MPVRKVRSSVCESVMVSVWESVTESERVPVRESVFVSVMVSVWESVALFFLRKNQEKKVRKTVF